MENVPTKLYDRWDIHQRAQHWMMMLSFGLLAITGLLIKFAYTSWAQVVSRIFGNFEILFGVHLTSAVLLMVTAGYHLIYLGNKAFKGQLRGSMLPGVQDLRDLGKNLSYLVGRSKNPPGFSKYSYKEKVDYLAEYWGTPVMILSGLILWFPGWAAGFMPRWLIECAHFVHQGEGLLAILVIFTWHFYAVHFSPDFFPMNKVWLTGKISREVMKHEYPLELARLEQEEVNAHGR